MSTFYQPIITNIFMFPNRCNVLKRCQFQLKLETHVRRNYVEKKKPKA